MSGSISRQAYEQLERQLTSEIAEGQRPSASGYGDASVPKEPPHDRDWHWITTETIRDPGPDFGPGILMIGLALCILLLVALL